MRINLTKKELVNAIYMQLGFSKLIAENLIDDLFYFYRENQLNLFYKNKQQKKKLKEKLVQQNLEHLQDF